MTAATRPWKLMALACYFLVAATGCAQLPQTSQLFELNPKRLELKGSRGLLSAQQSQALIDELKRKAGDSDIDVLQKHLAFVQAVVDSPVTTGNKVALLQDGPATYAAMFTAIEAAKQWVNLEIYLIEDDEIGRKFADLLLRKQAEGVPVLLIYDSVGSLTTPKAFFERLQAGGIQVMEFNPVNPLTVKNGRWKINKRDHRKLLVLDGKVAFVGGINISGVYSKSSAGGSSRSSGSSSGGSNKPTAEKDIAWRDTHVRLEGPVVAEFQKIFVRTWTTQKGPAITNQVPPKVQSLGKELVLALASDADSESVNYLTLLSAITHAEKTVYLTNAYFVPDPQLVNALMEAAQRRVDVRLLLPGQTDNRLVFHTGRSHYSKLLQAGVKIYERKNALLHAKSAVIDGVWSSVGSSNLDWRSFLHNNELDAVVLGPDFARQMETVFQTDLSESDAINLQQWERRPLHFRIQESVGRLWEYWL